MRQRNNVLPPVTLLTELDAREILARPLLALCQEHGPTRVAKALGGLDEKTIRNARDEKSTLQLDTAANLLMLDPLAFDGFLARVQRRSVPVDAVCDTDILPALTGATHQLAVATSPGSPGNRRILDSELLDAEDAIQTAFDQLGALLTRINQIKLGASQ